MVHSFLSSEIDYEENRSLLPEDKNKEASLYEITLFDKDQIIALGQPVYTFIERNIVYYPIYIVKNDKVSLQIGLYEVLADNVDNVLDEDGDIDLEQMGQPLLYRFVKKELFSMDDTPTEKKALASEAGPSEATANEEPSLPPQTKKDAEIERSQYVKQKDEFWFNSFMESNNYKMIENEGKGECLFAVIRDALARVNVFKTVGEMRKILADNANEDLFQGYKTMFQDSASVDEQLLKEIKVLSDRHKELKKQLGDIKDRNARQVIINQADEIKERHTLAKRERAYTKSVVEGELRIMKNIHNLEQFKKVIQTCSFWGDTWAISTLERVLNIKLILFSQESYTAGDLDNVLTCGQLNDTVLEEKGIFTPDYYILANYLGWHYQLISYKDKGALTFKEIPYDIKLKVVDKCLERLAGPYYIIPDFREFMEELKGLKEPSLAKEPSIELQSDLYNNDTIFQFYNKSLDKQPGKGVGEIIGSSDDYIVLKKIPDWRRKLDNSWIQSFTLDGRKWSSVEHYYQGSKYKRDHPEIYLQFSLDSGSSLSKDPALAKEPQMEKETSMTEEKKRHKKIKVDEDFIKRSEKEMELAQNAKFSQHKDLTTLLLETKKAKLQHFIRGSPPEIVDSLMRVRQTLHF